MNFRLRMLIPVIIVDALLFVYGLFTYVFFLRSNFLVREQNLNSQPLIIMGNGPSLSNDMPGIQKRRSEVKLCVVNLFANSELFFQLRPDFYVLADPVYWRQDVGIQHQEDNQQLISNLLRVSWDMTVICPEEGFDYFSNVLRGNVNIKIEKVKDNWMDFRTDFVGVLALRSLFFTPNFVNVLVLALWSGIIKGFGEIEIYGADFSSFKAINIDQDSNQLTIGTPHFYTKDNERVVLQEKYPGQKVKLIHTRMYQIALAFKQMYLLSKLADRKGVSILNGSTFSYLDCFDRPQSSSGINHDGIDRGSTDKSSAP